jgi:4-amino-4-deoxy-L-arabinose transferase-like glycosyltransferase
MNVAIPAPANRDLPVAAPRSATLYRVALAGVLALSGVLELNRLSRNGYANVFYSAGVKSMLRSWHNFLFVSFDPGGLVTIDKPPLGLWVQAASARLFGLSPLSLLAPEALAAVLAVAALYWALARPFGRPAALVAALALAVFPSFVAVSRDNNLDAILILLMVLAGGVALRAIERGRLRSLLACAVLVGLAFNTKTLAAYLIVPGIAAAYLVCAPGGLAGRTLRLLGAGALLAVVSFAWIALVDLTPASQRPFVGGSLNNTEFGLTFEYNGFGRVGGQVGGPGQAPVKTPASAPVKTPASAPVKTPASAPVKARPAPAKRSPAPAARLSAVLPNGRYRHPVAFGGATGPQRLFDTDLGDQGAWTLPLSYVGLLMLALSLLAARRDAAPEDARAEDPRAEDGHAGADATAAAGLRRDPRLAGLLVFGGWFVTEAVVLSFSDGIVHPYYVSALGPGAAAMLGAGAAATVALATGPRRALARLALALLALGALATVAMQTLLLHRAHYLPWLAPVLALAAAAGFGAVLARRRQPWPALAVTLGVLLLAPAVYSATTWQAPVLGTFPAAGPRQAAGYGGYDVAATTIRADHALIEYLQAHAPGRRWTVLTQASDTAAPLILLGLDAAALGGYSATDPALDGRGLARLVARHEARYVLLGGAYASRGGTLSSNAAARVCAQVPDAAWKHKSYSEYSLVLYDCAGHERELASA